MSLQFEKFNINAFWDSTPNKLKYIVILVLFLVGTYFIISRNILNQNLHQIDRIEQSIETTYILLNTFDQFKETQIRYNDEMVKYISNLYILVKELNDNTNQKFKILLQYNGRNSENILQNILLLNESFLKIQNAYTPEHLDGVTKTIESPYLNEEYKKHLLEEHKKPKK